MTRSSGAVIAGCAEDTCATSLVLPRAFGERLEPQSTRTSRIQTADGQSLGGRLEAFYYALGDTDLYPIELPANVADHQRLLSVAASGAGPWHTSVLLTAEEMDGGQWRAYGNTARRGLMPTPGERSATCKSSGFSDPKQID